MASAIVSVSTLVGTAIGIAAGCGFGLFIIPL